MFYLFSGYPIYIDFTVILVYNKDKGVDFMRIYDSISMTIGKTPLVRIKNIEKLFDINCTLLVKAEFLNPGGSIKDRVALNIITDLEERGDLTPGGTVIEPTSGNTGVGIAAICAERGYRAIIVMPDTMSMERRQMLYAYGAEVVLTDGKNGMKGAIEEASRLKSSIPGAVIAGQFENLKNPDAHKKTTGPEIYEDTDGAVDVLVAGVGTGGTITGVGEYLKNRRPEVVIVGVEPKESAVLSGESANPHGIQGIGAGFIPSVLNTDIIDIIEKVSYDEAVEFSRLLGKKEGIAVGISGGAALAATVRLAKLAEFENKTFVTILPDGADRYLSLNIYN